MYKCSMFFCTVFLFVSALVPVSATATDVGGHIASDSVWNLAGSPYIVTDTVVVDSGVTLTVEPGVSVKFNAGFSLEVYGTLVARGTQADSITFSANTLYPTPGYWGSIHFFSSAQDVALDGSGNYVSGCALEYCSVVYGGDIPGTYDDGAIRIEYATILIRNCLVSQNLGSYAAGVYCLYSYSILDSNSITHNSATAGGGHARGAAIRCSFSPLAVTGNRIEYNTAVSCLGAAIYCHYSSAVIERNEIINNSADLPNAGHGGGIYSDHSNSTIRSNLIASNSCGIGGGVYLSFSSPEVTGNFITSNTVWYGGGAFYIGNCSPTIAHNVIKNNVAQSYGGTFNSGGIKCSSASPIIRGNIIVNNTNWGTAGAGGIACEASSAPRIENNVICQNSWGVVVSNSSPSLKCNNIRDNDTLNVYIADQNWDIEADSNWWSTFSTDSIDAYIWDILDDITLGRVQYQPFLSSPLVGQPDLVYSVVLKTDATYQTDVGDSIEIGSNLYVQLVGNDTCQYSQDQTTVTAKRRTDPTGIKLILQESGDSTGIYRGVGYLGTVSDQLDYTLGASHGDSIWIISDADNSNYSTYIAYIVYPEVVADFSAQPESGLIPLEVQFTDLSDGEPTSWLWDFGDDSTSTDQHPIHTYNDTGYFDVRLIASNPGNSDTALKLDYIHVLPDLVADFSGDPQSGFVPLNVQFTDLSVGYPTIWFWDFGDGHSDTLQNPAHSYTDTGYFDVMLVASNSLDMDSLIEEDYIYVTTHPPDTCPEDPNDRGECDTLNVICPDCEIDTIASWPRFVQFPMLVTHDQKDEIDSITSFVIPLAWTSTNPSAYCSLGEYWNKTSTLWDAPDFDRSIFRHIVDGTDTLYHNRMADLAADYSGRDWDTRILELSNDPAYMHLAMISSGTADQRWWEGDGVLLATLTFKMQDTMHVCVDTTLWPPASHLSFTRSDAATYVPRDNLPRCFFINVKSCPEDPRDMGDCDSLNVTCLDCEPDTVDPGPRLVQFPLLVTHDLMDPIDSLAGFVVPLTWTRTNPSVYCSLGEYWNTTSTLWDAPDFDRSIFRHIVDGTDTLYHNRMADLAADYSGRDWDTRILELSTDSAYVRMAVIATGSNDQSWWEGERILLATLTFRIQDTMTVCMDTIFWPPVSNLSFTRFDAQTFVPRDNLPGCFFINALNVRGDANGDGIINVGDAVYLINYLFRNGDPPPLWELGDVNCDDIINVGDVVYLINYLYRNGDPPGCP